MKDTAFNGFQPLDDLDLSPDTPVSASSRSAVPETAAAAGTAPVSRIKMKTKNPVGSSGCKAPETHTHAGAGAPAYTAAAPARATATGFSNPFMTVGDLISVADGSRTEGKGSSWDDFALTKNTTVIGRAARCDLVIKQGGIALEHARIIRRGDSFILEDRRSDAGTYVNGARISAPVQLRERDQIAFGSSNYVFSGGRLIFSKTDDPETRSKILRTMSTKDRPVILRTNIQSKRVKNRNGSGTKELIRDIRLEVREGSLVAMLGTAGAGKSTVMNCMNGMDLTGVTGSAYYRDVDLVNNFDQMKHLIGSVPQEKIFHPTFTPTQEFRFAAEQRLPGDTTRKEIRERVQKTLELLSMTKVCDSTNNTLSGGEKTRVNMGIELVADRDLLCLDEPDQGLSKNYRHDVYILLQNLAHNHGKTVLTIIHDVSEIDMFDQIIFLTKVDGVGRLAYSGTPQGAREYFGVDDIGDAYELLTREGKRFVR